MYKVILTLMLVASACPQDSRPQERREERREDRRRRRHQRPAAIQPLSGPWTGILDPTRAIDWSHAGVWGSYPLTGGGIPNRTTACPLTPSDYTPSSVVVSNTLMPSGLTDITDATNINTALQKCGALADPAPPATPNPLVIQLGQGTFYIVKGVTFGGPYNSNGFTRATNNVTLRGAGPDKTILKARTFSLQDCGTYASTVCINGWGDYATSYFTQYAGGCSWTGGYAQGSTTLTLGPCAAGSSGSNFNGKPVGTGNTPIPGMVIILDQRNDDVGLRSCSSSGTTATCTVSTNALPSDFVVGACVGLGAVGTVTGVYSGNLPGANMMHGHWAAATPFQLSNQIVDSNGGLETDIAGYITTTGGTMPTWPTTLGGTVTDGTVVWRLDAAPWKPSTAYTAGQAILTSNWQVHVVKTAGTSGATAPTWNTTFGSSSTTTGDTSDGTVTWYLWSVQGYSASAKWPQNSPTNCNAITAVTSNTFSYTLPFGGANLAPVGPCSPGLPNGISGNNLSGCGGATVDTGGVYVTGTNCVTADAGPCPRVGGGNGVENGRMCPDAVPVPTCDTNELSIRSQHQIVKVVSVTPAGCTTSCTVTIDTPLWASNWRASRAPGIFWYQGSMHDDGIESLTIDCSDDGGATTVGSMMVGHCYNCWVRNMRSIAGSRNHLWLQHGVGHMTVRDSYFYGSKRGATQSYGVEVNNHTSDLLEENNIFIHIVTGVMPANGFGGVASYNYFNDDGYYSTGTMMAGMQPHAVNGFSLYESNNTGKSAYDNIHGTSPVQTHFRERDRAYASPPKQVSILGFQVSAYNRAINVVGSVLGTYGIIGASNYQCNGGGVVNCQTGRTYGSIWVLGSTSQNGNDIPDDALVAQTMLRWGNYDVVTKATRWCGNSSSPGWATTCGSVSEIPTGSFFGLSGNTVPATQTLPASFYLTAQPAFYVTPWGTPPWPSIGPDVTGGTAPDGTCGIGAIYTTTCPDPGAGMAYSIPAQLAENNAPFDSAFAITYPVTSIQWTLSASGGLSYSTATATGQFTIPLYGTLQVSGVTPSTFNGIFQVLQQDGPTGDAGINTTSFSGGTLPTGTYYASTTRLNGCSVGPPVTCTGETTPSAVSRQGNSGTIRTYSPCHPSTSSGCFQDGVPANNPQSSQYYNVYMRSEAETTGNFCLQNSAPIPLGTNFDQSTAIIDGPNPSCKQPPTHSTAISTQVTYYMMVNPGGSGSGTGGTIVSPRVKVFNADNYYGTGVTPPPSTTPSGITGHGTITGQGKIT